MVEVFAGGRFDGEVVVFDVVVDGGLGAVEVVAGAVGVVAVVAVAVVVVETLADLLELSPQPATAIAATSTATPADVQFQIFKRFSLPQTQPARPR